MRKVILAISLYAYGLMAFVLFNKVPLWIEMNCSSNKDL